MLDIYREMVRGYAIERCVLELVQSREFRGFYHPGHGQEGVQAAACRALRSDDWITYAHRGLTYLTAKGMDPAQILGDFLGRTSGSTRGLGAGTVHCVDPFHGIIGQGGTLGSGFPIAAGLALANQMLGNGRVAVAFFGDGASSRGTFHESAISAAAWNLPVVWLCENNGWAVSAALEEVQGVRSVALRAEGWGIPGIVVDGQDALAVHSVVSEAVERARRGDGPTLIEAMTVRFDGHYTGDMQPYRDKEELNTARGRDPFELLEAKLRQAGVTEQQLEDIHGAADEEMADALAMARQAPKPGPERISQGIWVEEDQ
jgi:pyruvate dehydrogenase E1 component alpha subunit